MKRLLGTLVLLAALTACGDEGVEGIGDPDPSSARTDAKVVAIVGGSAAGGDVGRTVTVLDTPQAERLFLRQFRSPSFAGQVRDALDAHPPADGRVLGAVVMDVSCDVAPSATVAEVDGEYVVTPAKVPSPHPECFAAVTSVAVVDLPA